MLGLLTCNNHAGGSNLTVMLENVTGKNSWVSENKDQSSEIINEMVEIMAHKVLCSLLSEVNLQRWFTLMANVTRDISNHEQLVLSLRWVSEQYEVLKDQVGLIQLDNTTAVIIYSPIKDCLIWLSIPFKNCREQAYHGTWNFQGYRTSVAKIFNDDYLQQFLCTV